MTLHAGNRKPLSVNRKVLKDLSHFTVFAFYDLLHFTLYSLRSFNALRSLNTSRFTGYDLLTLLTQ